MSYAVMITSKVDSTKNRQTLIATHNSNEYIYERITDGGRGATNAWAKILSLTNDVEQIVGEVLSTPLTLVDIYDLDNNKMPNVLIQKLTKQFRLRNQNVSDQLTNQDVFKEVLNLIQQSPDLLSKYRSDGRVNKSATTAQTPAPKVVVTKPIAPVIKVVQQEVSENALSFIPSLNNPEVSGYVNRTFAGGVTDFDVLDYAIANKENVAFVGDAGTGKTSCVFSWAGHRGLRVYRVNFHAGIESSTLFGKILPQENGNLMWQDGGFTECWRNGNAVIILDEMSFMPPKQSGILFPSLDNQRVLILLDNKGEVIPAGDNLLIVGCYNQNYRGNQLMNQAFLDRFQHKLVFDYDTEIEKK